MEQRVQVRLSKKNNSYARFSCEIVIEEGLFPEKIRPFLLWAKNPSSKNKEKPSSIVILTDSNLIARGNTLVRALSKETKVETNLISFKAGEKSKTIETAVSMMAKLDGLRADRKSLLVCLGGGVVGDLGGFISSIYKRGISYFQVPTTLLAQVDSSIGGKTGVDSKWGKNQLGTFYEPRGVLIDPNLLDTLPKEELINGTAEIVKYSIISNSQMFAELERSENLDSIESLKPFITQCVKIKSKIVSLDEKEDNLRSVLNFGHTVGHAIEASSEYTLSHGQSVILGMLAEIWIAKKLDIFREDEDYERIVRILTSIKPEGYKIQRKRIMPFALSDKKNKAGRIRMALPERIGKMHTTGWSYLTEVSPELLMRSLEYLGIA